MKNQGGEDAIGGKQGTYYSEGLEKEIAKKEHFCFKGRRAAKEPGQLDWNGTLTLHSVSSMAQTMWHKTHNTLNKEGVSRIRVEIGTQLLYLSESLTKSTQ